MRETTTRTRLLLLLGLILLGGVVSTLVRDEGPRVLDDVPVVDPKSSVDGRSLAEWSARHWQWTLGVPVGANPGQDVTGATCSAGQSGPVFFIPRNFPPCTVPTGQYILVPIVGSECSTVEPPPWHGENEAALRQCAGADVDRYSRIVVRVDGVLVPDITTFRAPSPQFSVELPEHNVLGVPAGEANVVADGYLLLLAPLPPGEHEIVAHIELADGTVLPDKVLPLTIAAP
jgi:hypothetical protein